MEVAPVKEKREHRSHHMFTVIVNFFIFLSLFILICMIVTDYDEGVFAKSEAALRSEYEFRVLPPTKTGLEICVYGYQVLWLIYNLILLTRESSGGYLYYSPEFLPFLVNISFSGTGVLNIVWLFLWSSQNLVAEISVMTVMVLLCLFSFVVAVRQLNAHGLTLLQHNLKLDVILTRLLVHNGLQTINTFLWLSFCAHIGLVLSVEGVMTSKEDAVTLALGLMAVYIVLEAIVTTFMFDTYTRYLFSTYVVQIWMLAAIVGYNFDSSERNSIIAVVILALSVLLLVIKLYRVIRASCVQPEPLLKGIVLEEDSVEIDDTDLDGVINLPPPQPVLPPNVEIINFMATDMPNNVPSQPGYRRPPPQTCGHSHSHVHAPRGQVHYTVRGASMPNMTGYTQTVRGAPIPNRTGYRQTVRVAPMPNRTGYSQTVRGAPMPNMAAEDLYHTIVNTGQPQGYRIDPERVGRY